MRRSLAIAVVLILVAVVAPHASASTRAVVHGTNVFPDDLLAVQAAVDTADRVVLEGTFDFGSGTLDVTRNIVLRGRRGALIRNGGDGATFMPTIHARAPATGITIRNLKMEASNDVAIWVQGTAASITGNDIRAALFSALLVESTADVVVRNNRLEADNAALFVVDTRDSRFANNTAAVVGNDVGPFGVGRTGVFLAPGAPGLENQGNTFRNTTLIGEMTYGYVMGEQAVGNRVFIAPNNLSRATFVPPPFFGLCGNGPGEPNEGGAAVLLAGANPDFGFTTSLGNVVRSRASDLTFYDCGVDNLVLAKHDDHGDDD